jgi:hypothetical protein
MKKLLVVIGLALCTMSCNDEVIKPQDGTAYATGTTIKHDQKQVKQKTKQDVTITLNGQSLSGKQH